MFSSYLEKCNSIFHYHWLSFIYNFNGRGKTSLTSLNWYTWNADKLSFACELNHIVDNDVINLCYFFKPPCPYFNLSIFLFARLNRWHEPRRAVQTAQHGSKAFEPCYIFNCKVEPLYRASFYNGFLVIESNFSRGKSNVFFFENFPRLLKGPVLVHTVQDLPAIVKKFEKHVWFFTTKNLFSMTKNLMKKTCLRVSKNIERFNLSIKNMALFKCFWTALRG